MYYKCAECERVLDERKFPQDGPCPYCSAEDLQADKTYRGSRARRLPGVTRDVIEQGVRKRETARNQHRTASIVNYAWAAIALATLGILLPFATPKLYYRLVEREVTATSYLTQYIPQFNELSTQLIANGNVWPEASAATAAAAPGGVLTFTYDRLRGGARLCVWVAIVTGLVGGVAVALLYLKAIQWPDFRRRAHLSCLVILVVVLGVNYFGARTLARQRAADYTVHAPVIESMLGMLVYAELLEKDGAGAVAHLQAGAPRDFRDGRGAGYLHIAAENGVRDVMETLIQWGLDVNDRDAAGKTPLHYAAARGRVFVSEILVQHGANLKARDAEGRGVLHFAAARPNTTLLEDYLERGLDVNLADEQGRTPLVAAAEAGNAEAITLLLKAGANLEARNPEGHTLLQVTMMNLINNMFRDSGPTEEGDPQLRVARALLDRGANVNAVDSVSQTPLHWIRDARVRVADDEERSAYLDSLMELLFEYGADFSRKDLAGRPAYSIHDAARMGHLAAAERMLESDPENAIARDERNRTAFQIAVEAGHLDLVQALLDHGADVNAWESLGESPLTYAIDRLNVDMVRLLLEHGVKTESERNGQGSPLIHAARAGSAEIAELLIDRGCPVNEADVYGDTPLHVAAAGGHETVVRLLLDHGADTSAWNRSGKTPLDMAVAGERKRVASILRRMPLGVSRAVER